MKKSKIPMGISVAFPEKYSSLTKNLPNHPSCISTVPAAARDTRKNQRRALATSNKPRSSSAI